jgi:hypothetical protein
MRPNVTKAIVMSLILLAHTQVLAQGSTDTREIVLEQQWEVGTDADSEVIFGVISGLDVDASGNVYVVDRQLTIVSKFSPEGEYLGPLGREGDGPGEYRRIGYIFAIGPEEMAVMQRMPGKIVTLTTTGLPGRTIELPAGLTETPAYFFSGQASGDDVFILSNQMQREGDEFTLIRSLVRISSAGEEIARMSEVHQETNLSDFKVEEKSQSPVIWAVAPNGHVYLSDEFDAYRIREYDSTGQLVNTIERQYEHRRRNSKEMDENTPRMAVQSQQGDRVDAEGTPSTTDRDLQALFVRPDGALWVLTSRGAFDQAEGNLATFDVYSDGMEFSHQMVLHGNGDFHDDGLRLIGNRLFLMRGLRAAQLTSRGEGDESDDAIPMSIVCYELDS